MSKAELALRVRELLEKKPKMGRAQIAKIFGLKPDGILRGVVESVKAGMPVTDKEAVPEKNPPSETREFTDNSGVIATCRRNVRNLQELLEFMQVDLEVWEVERHVINKWEVGAKDEKSVVQVTPLYQVKAWLRRKMPTALAHGLEKLETRLAKVSPKHRRTVTPGADHMLEIALYDAHFGLLAWGKETGEDYDLKIAEQRYLAAVDELLARGKGCAPELIIFPIGNDFFHVNNPDNVTPTAHHLLDVDGRLPKVIEAGQMALIRAIDACTTIAPVQVLWIPGNHDPQTSYYLCRILAAWFRNHKGVSVDVSPSPRKYVRYGCTLLGFTHGNEERHSDLPTLMAGERKQDWSEARHYEWHVGHYHRKRETRYSAGDTFGAVSVKTIPSICGTDAWHFKKGYVNGERVADAFVYSKTQGLVATFTCRDLRNLHHAPRRSH
jgi:hypothetical protein